MATQKKSYSKKQFFERRISSMDLERSSFVGHWRECAEYVSPRRGRFFTDDRNRGDKRYKSIINSKATLAHSVARAGMLSGIASPSRQWFGIETSDPELMEVKAVREWCSDVQRRIAGAYNHSNFYTSASTMLGELLLFGTGAMLQEEDDETVFRFYPYTIGSYYIAQDERGVVNAFARKFQMTTEQMVSEFGYENCSVQVRNAYDAGTMDGWHDVTYYLGPNTEYDDSRITSKYKKYSSCYWQPGLTDPNQFLRESGYDEFPMYIPRWDLTGEDIYATSWPTAVALGDIKQLQIEERRKAQAIDKFVNPPLKGPASLRNVPVSSLPGGLTVYDPGVDKEGLSPIYQVDPRINELMQDIEKIERRIDDVYYVPLFFAITQMEGIQPKNELELNQRNQERLLQLGPVLERLHTEFLQRCVERSFNIMMRKDMLPPPPAELAGASLKVTFVSSLAMAQRSEAASGIQDLRLFVTELASGGFQEVVDKYDADQAVDELAQILGVPPSIIRSDEQVAQIRQDRQQQSDVERNQLMQAQLSQQLLTRTNQ